MLLRPHILLTRIFALFFSLSSSFGLALACWNMKLFRGSHGQASEFWWNSAETECFLNISGNWWAWSQVKNLYLWKSQGSNTWAPPVHTTIMWPSWMHAERRLAGHILAHLISNHFFRKFCLMIRIDILLTHPQSTHTSALKTEWFMAEACSNRTPEAFVTALYFLLPPERGLQSTGATKWKNSLSKAKAVCCFSIEMDICN